jgi:hypothetical protein
MGVYYLVHRLHTTSEGTVLSKIVGVYLSKMDALQSIKSEDTTLFDYTIEKVLTDKEGRVLETLSV